MAMTLRLDEEVDSALTEYAHRTRQSKQQVVERAVVRLLDAENHAARTMTNARRVIAENTELLDALAHT